MDEQALPEYTAEKLAENFPNRVDPMLLSGPYTPIYRARAEIDRLKRENERFLDLLERARRLLSVCSFDAPEDVSDLDLIHGSSHSAGGDA